MTEWFRQYDQVRATFNERFGKLTKGQSDDEIAEQIGTDPCRVQLWKIEMPQVYELPQIADAYEVYGLTRTGCCGCPISYKAVDDLEKIRPYEPNVVKAAWNIFGKSYEYRRKYNEYKESRKKSGKKEGTPC